MAAPTLAQIRAGLETRLAAITDANTSAYLLSNPTPPFLVVVGPGEVAYHQAMQNGHDTWIVLVQAWAGLQSDVATQKLLDQYIAGSGSKSVKAAIEGDTTLGGVVDSLIVESCSGYRVYVSEQAAYLGAEWSVRIIAPGA